MFDERQALTGEIGHTLRWNHLFNDSYSPTSHLSINYDYH